MFCHTAGHCSAAQNFEARKIDLVHCHMPTGGVVARLAALGMKDRPIVVYTVHGFHFYKGAPLVNWLVFFPVEWLLSWCTDCIVTIDEEDYQNAQKLHMGMKQLRLIHGVGVRLERYSGPVREDAKDALRKALRWRMNRWYSPMWQSF